MLLAQAGTRLEEAQTLFAAELYEGSVGRSYYAAFTAARAMLASDLAFPKTHAGVLHEFGRRYVKSGILPANLHAALARLEGKRNIADYGSGPMLNENDAKSALAVAEEMIKAASKYLANR